MIKNLAKSTLTSVVYLAVALVMYGAMKSTRPSQNQHANAVTGVVEKVIDDIFENRIEFPAESKELANKLSTDVIPNAVEKLRHGKIDLTDYWIFNIGSVTDEEGNEDAVSLGILGKVFVFDEDKIREDIENSVNENMKEFMENKGTEENEENEEDSL